MKKLLFLIQFIPLFLIQPVFGESAQCQKARADYSKAEESYLKAITIRRSAYTDWKKAVAALDTVTIATLENLTRDKDRAAAEEARLAWVKAFDLYTQHCFDEKE